MGDDGEELQVVNRSAGVGKGGLLQWTVEPSWMMREVDALGLTKELVSEWIARARLTLTVATGSRRSPNAPICST